jgi:hypothetical protein
VILKMFLEIQYLSFLQDSWQKLLKFWKWLRFCFHCRIYTNSYVESLKIWIILKCSITRICRISDFLNESCKTFKFSISNTWVKSCVNFKHVLSPTVMRSIFVYHLAKSIKLCTISIFPRPSLLCKFKLLTALFDLGNSTIGTQSCNKG